MPKPQIEMGQDTLTGLGFCDTQHMQHVISGDLGTFPPCFNDPAYMSTCGADGDPLNVKLTLILQEFIALPVTDRACALDGRL